MTETIDALVRRVDEDRWLASRFADPLARQRLLALYAAYHEIARTPEIVTQDTLGAIRLQWWRDAIASIYSGADVAKYPVAAGLAELVQEASLDRALLEGLVDAREKDLETQPFATWPELETYIDHTAGAVVMLAAKVCAPDLVQTRQHEALFRAAGRVWGYTGLVRALGSWNGRRRTFFPQKALDHVKLSLDDLFAGETTHATSSACRQVLERAGASQREVSRLAHTAPKEFFPAFGYVALAGQYIRALDRPYDGVARVPLLQRQWRLVTASATGRI